MPGAYSSLCGLEILPKHIASNMRRVFLIALLGILFASPLAAQNRRGDQNLSEFYTYGDSYFIEVITSPGMTPTKGRAVVLFRLSHDLLSFRKATQAYHREGVYMATPTLYFEAIGSDGVIVDHETWRDTAHVEDYAATNSKADFLSGFVELELRPGVYTIKYSYDNGIPGSGFTQTTPPFKMDDFHSPSPAIGIPIFLRQVRNDTLTAAAVDGAAIFGQPLRVYVPLSSQSAPASLHYELQSVSKDKKPGMTLRSGFATMIGHAVPGEVVVAGNDIHLILRRGDSGVPAPAYGAFVETGTEDLAVGDYLLLLRFESGGNSVLDSVNFRLSWVGMPVSLARAEYAIRVLYPVATDETIDGMLDGNKDRQRAAVDAFWQQRDPTPDTRFNEAMHEYYQRVDYSFFNFKSISQSDGAFTDRGKIYILYGPPTEIRREMQPQGPPTEVWIYRNRVGQQFIFADESRSGAYKLVEYNDL